MRIVGVVTALVGCGPVENPIPKGSPIPDSHLASCGDALVDAAPPAGAVLGSLTVGDATTFEGTVMLQASCPREGSRPPAETEFDLSRLELDTDDAGFPGDEIGGIDVAIGGVVSCEGITHIGGHTESVDIPPTEAPSLAEACADFLADPPGHPLYVQVSLVGTATTCSNQQFPILLRSKLGVDCGD